MCALVMLNLLLSTTVYLSNFCFWSDLSKIKGRSSYPQMLELYPDSNQALPLMHDILSFSNRWYFSIKPDNERITFGQYIE